jgi:hypothetical protein
VVFYHIRADIFQQEVPMRQKHCIMVSSDDDTRELLRHVKQAKLLRDQANVVQRAELISK